MKGLLNIAAATSILLIISPIIILTSLLIIILELKSPLFLQVRLGLNKKPFTIYKIRSMANGKVTKIGKIIRKTGIDELPQLLNIIQGKIVFIGPRPLSETDIIRLGWNTEHHNFRWQVKPGLSGLAQLSPVCHKKISLFWDRYYINNQSFLLDLKIVIASVFVMFIGKNRVKKLI